MELEKKRVKWFFFFIKLCFWFLLLNI
jgi:hypothetical protein